MGAVKSYLHAVDLAVEPLRDSRLATAMAAYMKNNFPFLGIPTPARRKASKAIPKPDPAHAMAIVRALWKRKEREFHYIALDLLDAMARKLDPLEMLELIHELALKHSWWDSIDGLAATGSAVFRLNPDLRPVVLEWSAHDSFWVNRLAILHQNGWKEKTDKPLLFKLILAHAGNEEIFIRKAIGWALRDYAWTNPKAVQDFVERNRSKLSALSAREALKNVGAA